MPITTAPTPQPAGQQHQQQHHNHRRIHSLKTTLNFFKASKTLAQVSPVRRRELTISTPIYNAAPSIIGEEDDAGISPTEPRPAPTPTPTPTTPLSRSGVGGPIFDTQSYSSRFHSTPSFEGTGRRRGGTPLGRGSELNGGATDIEGQMNPRTRSPDPSGTSDLERSSNDKQSSTASGGGKKTAAKLRMALSLLSRRRSNPNLRKAYVAPVDENGATRDSWGPFNEEPLLDPDYVEAGRFSPSVTATPARRPSTTTKSSGFKFTLPVRGSSRNVLSKPRREDQPRRATVASVILGDESQAGNGWDGIGARPRSSQSTLPGELTVPDEPGDGSLFSRESAALGAPSPGQGGLFPRPASLQRHWSGGAQKKIEEADPNPTSERTTQLRQHQDPNRVRPLSFGSLSNGFGSLKITEAAALESRVKELEIQVADLRSIIAESANWSPQPFDESVLSHSNGFNVSPGTSFSRPNSDTAVAPEESLRYEQVSPRGSVATRDRERTLSVLEGIHLDPENKRSTLSTIRAPRRGSTSVSVNENSTQSVNMAEYTGIVTMVKREQKARRRLEQQVAALQEQMATVLHRQLIADSSHRSPILESVSPRRRHHHTDFNALHRKASSEVPTPDITPPPSSSNAAARQSANIFTSFDSGAPPSDDGHSTNSYYDAGRTNSDAWQTPSEEKENMLERTDSASTFGEPLLVFPPPGGNGSSRTLSLSQLTLKSSSKLARRV